MFLLVKLGMLGLLKKLEQLGTFTILGLVNDQLAVLRRKSRPKM